jgi:hypothetical protein
MNGDETLRSKNLPTLAAESVNHKVVLLFVLLALAMSPSAFAASPPLEFESLPIEITGPSAYYTENDPFRLVITFDRTTFPVSISFAAVGLSSPQAIVAFDRVVFQATESDRYTLDVSVRYVEAMNVTISIGIFSGGESPTVIPLRLYVYKFTLHFVISTSLKPSYEKAAREATREVYSEIIQLFETFRKESSEHRIAQWIMIGFFGIIASIAIAKVFWPQFGRPRESEEAY